MGQDPGQLLGDWQHSSRPVAGMGWLPEWAECSVTGEEVLPWGMTAAARQAGGDPGVILGRAGCPGRSSSRVPGDSD